ncbi:tetratricopeptide repeat domain-containing protein [Aspergillus udagawae]|nr:tetratricopeptide repeat domain-containing protein [Aspergillus udagawae]
MVTTMGFATTGQLQELRGPVDNAQDVVDIILVPGIGTTLPQNWPFANEEWLASLPGSGAGARVLAYEYASPFAGTKPSWESMLMLGYDFLQHLSDERSQFDSDPTINRPILIVCHSLGGIVVKQALCVANKQFPRYGSIVNAIAGVVFLSTPHRYGDKTTSWNRFRDILDATTGRNLKISSANIEQEGSILLDLADRFEGIAFRTPILSVYELRESKNSSTPLRPKYQQLVNREACSTHAPMETVIGLNLNHHDTCLFTKSVGGEGLPELNKFIYETLDNAVHLVARRLEDQEYQYATMSAYSPTMSELPLKGELWTQSHRVTLLMSISGANGDDRMAFKQRNRMAIE